MGNILSDLASGATSGVLGSIGTLAKDLREAFTGEIPADKRAELEQKLLELENQAMLAQTQINLVEAGSEHWFVASWRPFIGWCGGLCLCYVAILEPLMSWIAMVNGYKGDFPAIDTSLTMQVLLAILGVGTMRSFDKKQSPAPKGKE